MTPTVPIAAGSPLLALPVLDWDFRDADTGYLTHGLHPYPAKFIPHIPRTLIEALSKPGDVVADVFCGSGTTLVEALLLGRHAVGVDASELACLISEAKTTRLTTNDYAGLEALASRTRSLLGSIEDGQPGLFTSHDPALRYDLPESEAIRFWFDPHVAQELATLRSLLAGLPTGVQVVGKTCLSSIIVAVSKQDSDTRYVRRDKTIRPGETCRRFLRALHEATAALSEFSRRADGSFARTVLHADVLSSPDIGAVDLVVSSPPYPNAYSYHLYHMTRMLWLGMDQPSFKSREIGSHRKYSRKGPNGATAATFKRELESIFAWLFQHIRPHGHCCFVIGDSIIKGHTVRNDELVVEAAVAHGFSLVTRITRRLQDTRKAFNPKIGKIKEEHIVILQRR